ncbi:MAG: hypothetical protein ACKVP4_02450 [Hyphomicrobium sp.]
MSIDRLLAVLVAALRRWKLIALPLLVSIPFALLLLFSAPIKYAATSTILMVSANKGGDGSGGGGAFPRQNAVEQLAVLEAWLKSDHVLRELLPELLVEKLPADPKARLIQMTILRKTLTLELIGAGVLEIRLEGYEAEGLGRKLEIILARLMEGIIRPEAGILSAAQFIVLRRGEGVAEAEAALNRAIAESGAGPADVVKSKLEALTARMTTGSAASDARKTEAVAVSPSDVTEPAVRDGAADRATIAADAETVDRLMLLYTAYRDARAAYTAAQSSVGAQSTSYVRVFDAPEKLIIVGRPRDPLVGESSGWKHALAVLFLAVVASGGLAVLIGLIDPRVRVRDDFEAISGVPLAGRLAQLPQFSPKTSKSQSMSKGPAASLRVK